MTIALVTSNVWKEITAAARRARNRSAAAVAYAGSGASRLLPLQRGSRLVVDASEAAVRAGQTNPAELSRFLRRGVRVYSVSNLHAKIFVFGREVFTGSTNVSHRSASGLVEAALRTTDRTAVKAAHKFVNGLCLHELGPEALRRLGRLYHPPRFPGATGRRRGLADGPRPELPRLLLTQLNIGELPQGSEDTLDKGRKAAKARRKHGRGHVLEEFFDPGTLTYQERDTIVQVLDEGDGSTFVYPAGNVVHTQKWSRGGKRCTFVYLERPKRKRIRVSRLAKRLGRGARKKLQRDGVVRNRAFAEQLLAVMQR